MKNLIIGFLISCLVHLFSFYFFLIQHKPEKKSVELNAIELYPELSISRTVAGMTSQSADRISSSSAQPLTNRFETEGSTLPSSEPGNQPKHTAESVGPNGIEYSKESRYIPISDTSRSLLYSRTHSTATFKETLIGISKPREDIRKKVQSWFFSTAPASSWTRPDPATDYLKKLRGSSPVLGMSGAPSMDMGKKQVEQNRPQFDFLPNRVQLSAMTSLYRMKQGTQTDIYADMDVSLLVTAEGLDANLDFLVKKGFLKRKKISPELPLTLFGVATVEMSRKNKLNPLYQYTPTVDRTTLISYFQAQIYLLKEKMKASSSDSQYLQNQIDNMQNMIQVLIQTT